jgi:uncharacterized protein
MKIIISEIPEEGLDLEFEDSIKSDDTISPVRAHLNINKAGTEVVIKGKLSADVELQCSRCLKDFRTMLTLPVDVIYNPVENLKGKEKHELKTDELDTSFYYGDELDLLDLLKEQIILNLPMKPLCSELCKGICLQCGADLNTGNCSCSEREINPRLEVLKKILDKGA